MVLYKQLITRYVFKLLSFENNSNVNSNFPQVLVMAVVSNWCGDGGNKRINSLEYRLPHDQEILIHAKPSFYFLRVILYSRDTNSIKKENTCQSLVSPSSP